MTDSESVASEGEMQVMTPDEVRSAFADLLARELGEKRSGGLSMSGKHNPLPSETRWAARFIEDFEAAMTRSRPF